MFGFADWPKSTQRTRRMATAAHYFWPGYSASVILLQVMLVYRCWENGTRFIYIYIRTSCKRTAMEMPCIKDTHTHVKQSNSIEFPNTSKSRAKVNCIILCHSFHFFLLYQLLCFLPLCQGKKSHENRVT